MIWGDLNGVMFVVKFKIGLYCWLVKCQLNLFCTIPKDYGYGTERDRIKELNGSSLGYVVYCTAPNLHALSLVRPN